MNENDDLLAGIGHVLLAGMAGSALSRASGSSFTHPGMHANYLLHGVVGGLQCIAGTTGLDVSPVYAVSTQAVKYLAVPSLMADLYHEEKCVSIAHIASGLVPFAVSCIGYDNPHLSNLVVSFNVISMCYYAMKNNQEFAWYTAGCGLVTYFGLTYVKALFPIGLAATEFCAYKLYKQTFDNPQSKKQKQKDPKKKEPKVKAPKQKKAKAPKPPKPPKAKKPPKVKAKKK